MKNERASPACAVHAAFEPDKRWKKKLKTEIATEVRRREGALQRLLSEQLDDVPVHDVQRREVLSKEYKESMGTLYQSAQDRYNETLERERQKRRLAAVQQVDIGILTQSNLDSRRGADQNTAHSPNHGHYPQTPQNTLGFAEREGQSFRSNGMGTVHSDGSSSERCQPPAPQVDGGNSKPFIDTSISHMPSVSKPLHDASSSYSPVSIPRRPLPLPPMGKPIITQLPLVKDTDPSRLTSSSSGSASDPLQFPGDFHHGRSLPLTPDQKARVQAVGEKTKEEETAQRKMEVMEDDLVSSLSSLWSSQKASLERILSPQDLGSSLDYPVPADLTGQITTVQEEFDSGGCAVIYRGRWRNNQGECDIAVKVLRVSKRGNDGGIRLNKRFGREIRAWHRLDHPNIVKLLGVSYHMGGRPAMIMHWHRNGNAAWYLAQRQNSGADKMALIDDVAHGLTYLHTLDPPVVHGDLKANNILITDDGRAALTDFGLSQVIEETIGPSGLTTTTVAGTIRWQAPEVMSGELDDGYTEKLTIASDVWSFACTAYELLTGMIPYYQHRVAGPVVMDVMKGIKPRWEENGSALCEASKDLRGLLDHCWSFDAPQRPSMLEVVARLGTLNK